jgi:hypothetical protein
MVKKHSILIGIGISLLLLIIATKYYPGGSNFDKTTIGFSWTTNYISNLFADKAVNGMENGARYWAVGSMMILSLSFSMFFVQFSKRIPHKGSANLIKFLGSAGMVFTFLIATPLHDLMVIIASTIFLICIFYITVFVFKSKLNVFKLFCTLYMLLFYSTLFLYGTSDFRSYLPIIQKVLFGSTILLILALHYFTSKENFKI